jgi:two-component system phosphate regulon sensor histidine kinase PhoR
MVDPLPWVLLTAALGVAGYLGWRWRQAEVAARRLQAAANTFDQNLRTTRDRCEQLEAQLSALELAEVDAVLILNWVGTIERLNTAAKALFGASALPGQSLMTATRSVDLDELVQSAKTDAPDLDRHVTLNGLPYRARVAYAEEQVLVLTLREMSELQRLGRARRDFIANISHELRTPLTSIRLLVESLLSGVTNDPEATHGLLEKITTELNALEQMAQELLDLAQIESGQSVVRLVPTPLRGIVDRTVERLALQARHKQQDLSVHVPPDLTALADPDQLDRALGNLVQNAIKFTPDRGSIRIQAHRANGDVVVSVSDNGPGIPAGDQPRVFERFFRSDRARLRQTGTGLGLAIAKHVVEAHGGRIWVESEGIPGRGASFFFTLLPAE